MSRTRSTGRSPTTSSSASRVAREKAADASAFLRTVNNAGPNATSFWVNFLAYRQVGFQLEVCTGLSVEQALQAVEWPGFDVQAREAPVRDIAWGAHRVDGQR